MDPRKPDGIASHDWRDSLPLPHMLPASVDRVRQCPQGPGAAEAYHNIHRILACSKAVQQHRGRHMLELLAVRACQAQEAADTYEQRRPIEERAAKLKLQRAQAAAEQRAQAAAAAAEERAKAAAAAAAKEREKAAAAAAAQVSPSVLCARGAPLLPRHLQGGFQSPL